MLTLPPALAALGAWPQFVCWFAQPKPGNPGKLDKFPCDWRTGAVVGINDRDAWTTPDNALAVHSAYDRGWGSGAGFVFTADDPFFFADIDGAAQPDPLGGPPVWSPLAQGILARFPGAAVELSQSGRGLHIFGQAAPMAHGKRNISLNLELYTEGRFCALTGVGALGDASTVHTAALAQYVADYFPVVSAGAAAGWTTEPCAEWRGPTDDDELIRRMLASGQRQTVAQAFGAASQAGAGAPTLRDLWEGDADALARQWPGEGGKAYNASSADMALANQLAWWTGRDCDRIERLMRRSALAREKWDTHRTYLVDTITQAAGFIRGCLTDPASVVTEDQVVAAVEAGRTLRDATREWMGAFDQIEHFRGCYYLSAQERVYSFRHDMTLGKSAFDVLFGGHLFVLDQAGSKTTPSAWEAFTQSRVNAPLVVFATCFRPERLPGALISEGGRTLVNAYVPYEPRIMEGDPSPFLNHLAKMLPVERDRNILLHWMARVAQSPGRKLQWWPILQGVEGNGKSSCLRVMAYLAGREHTHLVNVETMAKTGGQFNSWIKGKTFLGLEEIKVEDRRHFLNVLKPYVTEEELPQEGKGVDQKTGDNRANGMGTSNFVDGIPIDNRSRRYGMFLTAQQEETDLVRDGMTSTYFRALRDWWKGEGAWSSHGSNYGYAVVGHYLRNFAMTEELDPANHARAPHTSTHSTAVEASLGRVEQEILEAIDEGRQGFAGGWVSSIMLDRLLSDVRGHVARNKRKELLAALGYDPHPALPAGRVNEVVTPDNGKPKLYVKRGHLAANLTTAKGVAEAYSKAQTAVALGTAALVFKAPA